MLIKIVAGLVMLSVLVVIHEAGHMVVARLFKVGVPVFSVGMGPRIGGFQVGDTDFRISALPIGGYVMMAGADPFGEQDPDAWIDPEEDFMNKPVWQRLLVMLAGPGANLVLPLFLFSAILVGGEPRPAPVVGMVLPDTPAAEAGLQIGDTILAVEGREVDVWGEFARGLRKAHGEPVDLVVSRGGERLEMRLPERAVALTKDGFADLRATGLSWMQVSSRVGVDDPSSPAARAGLQTGDAIVQVGDTQITTWGELQAELAEGDVHELVVQRAQRDDDPEAESTAGTEVISVDLTLRADPSWAPREGDPHAGRWGLAPVMLFVGAYAEDSAAEEAGVQLEDRIYAVDGQPVRTWYDLIDLVQATAPPDRPVGGGGCLGPAPDPPEPRMVELTVIRDGELKGLEFRPRMTRELVRTMVAWRPLLGIVQYPDAFVEGPEVHKAYPLHEAVPEAARQTAGVVGATLGVLGQFLSQERKMKETIGGPIAIFDMAGESVESGLASFVRMMAAISIGLGIINLLPVPVLDGGQILFYAIEGIRGRPLSIALREKIQMIGVLFLVALILIVSVHDISRVISGS